MGQLLRYFPLGDIGRLGWPTNLIVWMQDVHRAVSGDYNVIHLSKNTATENIGGAVGTKVLILWDEEPVKQPGFVHSTSSNTSQIQVENTGRYGVIVNIVGVNGAVAGVQIKMYIKKNGSEYLYESTAYDYAIGTNWRVHLRISSEIELKAGDYIEVETYVVQTGAGQAVTTSAAECEFIVRRIA